MVTARHDVFCLVRFFVFVDLDNFASLVVATVRADGVRESHIAAVTARDQVTRRQGIMGATAVAAAL